jgi:superkiller protein 3
MNNTKANLKNAREALGSKKFEDAIKFCRRVLDWESQNYNAYVPSVFYASQLANRTYPADLTALSLHSYVFLGVAHNGLDQVEDAENAYKKAIDINPEQQLAWQGLVSFYEKREQWTKLADTLEKLIDTYLASGDNVRLCDSIQKLVDIYQNKDANETKVRDNSDPHIGSHIHYCESLMAYIAILSTAHKNSLLLLTWKQIS